jgi:ubiquitin carboxyl-terminal hydrolase 5/13
LWLLLLNYRQKTAKSTLELEVELNATYAFDAITESGATLVPVSGPGYQGLQNLGNSCYINSVVQMLFSGTVVELASRYGTEAHGDIVHHPLLKVSPTQAPQDLLCQIAKIACALNSGTFSIAAEESSVQEEDYDSSFLSSHPKHRIPPRMFKHVVGNDHVDFCTGQQQDAAQFLQYLLEKMDRAELGAAASGRLWNKVDASLGIPRTLELFAFKTTSRIVCTVDNKVQYKDNHPETILSLRIPMEKSQVVVDTSTATTSGANETLEPEEKRQRSEEEEKKEVVVPTVTLQACLDSWADAHSVDGVRWSHLDNHSTTAMIETRLANFPRYVIIQIQRYELGPDWTPRKLEVKIDVPEEIDLSAFRCKGPQDGEDIVVSSSSDDEKMASGDNKAQDASTASPPTRIDEESLAQLMDMGFGMNGCIRALNAVGGSNVELAMNWIFEHNNDVDFNDPLPTDDAPDSGHENNSSSIVDEEMVSSLVENLGCFTADQVRAALLQCGGAADRAADWLFSHMDDLESAVANLKSQKAAAESGQQGQSRTDNPYSLEDGEGKYRLVGLVSHIGKNTTSGHYVAHLKHHNDKWVIFNDEKVAWSETPPIPHAYLYLFQRIDSIGSPNPSY